MTAVDTAALAADMPDPLMQVTADVIHAATLATRILRWRGLTGRPLLIDCVQVTPDEGVALTFLDAIDAAHVAGRLDGDVLGPVRAPDDHSPVLRWETEQTDHAGAPVRVIVEGTLNGICLPCSQGCAGRTWPAQIVEHGRPDECPWCITDRLRAATREAGLRALDDYLGGGR